MSIGKLIKQLNKSETIFAGNGGPHPSGLLLSTADYKHGKILKSCYTEFCLHPQCGFFPRATLRLHGVIHIKRLRR